MRRTWMIDAAASLRFTSPFAVETFFVPFSLDPAAFDPAAVTPETRALNADILAKLAALPDTWAFPPSVVRELRRQGRGPFPLPPPDPRATTLDIPGPRGPIELRVIRPDGALRGVHLHIHGGGWTFGFTGMHDPMLAAIADDVGVAVVSVEYKLAPEFPYPAGPDDCEMAALWLLREAPARFGTQMMTIGGESAGAHLSVVTLLRLRDRHGLRPFRAALLTAGCYDLALTPSARRWGAEKLILNTRDIRHFVRCFVPDGVSLADPDVSPIHADLGNLPPALFSIGTRDPLLDDSLFMAARWQAAGNDADLAIWPGGCHVFQFFPGTMTAACLARGSAFLAARL
jgi:acetyl esterase/lipase